MYILSFLSPAGTARQPITLDRFAKIIIVHDFGQATVHDMLQMFWYREIPVTVLAADDFNLICHRFAWGDDLKPSHLNDTHCHLTNFPCIEQQVQCHLAKHPILGKSADLYLGYPCDILTVSCWFLFHREIEKHSQQIPQWSSNHVL